MTARDGYRVYVGLGVPSVCVAVLHEADAVEFLTDPVDTRRATHTQEQESSHMPMLWNCTYVQDRRDAWVPDMIWMYEDCDELETLTREERERCAQMHTQPEPRTLLPTTRSRLCTAPLADPSPPSCCVSRCVFVI